MDLKRDAAESHRVEFGVGLKRTLPSNFTPIDFVSLHEVLADVIGIPGISFRLHGNVLEKARLEVERGLKAGMIIGSENDSSGTTLPGLAPAVQKQDLINQVKYFRRALYSGALSSSLIMDDGHRFRLPKHHWGDDRLVKEAFMTGRMTIDENVQGRVIISLVNLIEILDSLPKLLLDSQPKTLPPSQDESLEPYFSGSPGRPTGRHLYEAEFRRRAELGTAEHHLASEARYLQNWVREKHPSAPQPTVCTIQNNIREMHREYKRSHIPSKNPPAL